MKPHPFAAEVVAFLFWAVLGAIFLAGADSFHGDIQILVAVLGVGQSVAGWWHGFEAWDIFRNGSKA